MGDLLRDASRGWGRWEKPRPLEMSPVRSATSADPSTFYLGLYPDTCLLGTQQKKNLCGFPFLLKVVTPGRELHGGTREHPWLCAATTSVCHGENLTTDRQTEGDRSIQHGQGCCKNPWKMPHLALSQNPTAGSILCTAPCGHPALRSGAGEGSG